MGGNVAQVWFGLARRAGKVAHGATAVKEALDMGGVHLILLAKDAGKGTKRQAEVGGKGGKVPILVKWSKKELGELLGDREKAIAAITDCHLAERILATLAGDSMEI